MSRVRPSRRPRVAAGSIRALSMCLPIIAGGAEARDTAPLPAMPEDLTMLALTVRPGSIAQGRTRLGVDLDEACPANPRLRRYLLARWREHAAARRAVVRIVQAPRTTPGRVSSCDAPRPVPPGACGAIGGVSGFFECATPASGRP